MILKGKAKVLFEAWYLRTICFPQPLYTKSFKELPMSMQWGVYQEFADSLGYDINCIYEGDRNIYTSFIDIKLSVGYFKSYKATRKEAQEECLKKFNEIINSNESTKIN